MDFIVTTAPIVILIYLMTKKNSVPSHVALPAVALLTYGIKLIYFAEPLIWFMPPFSMVS
jgi:lactate permease